MQFEFLRNLTRQITPDDSLTVGGRTVALVLVRNPRARRYLLRLRPDGAVRVTIPRGGSATEARRFAERNTDWIAQTLQRQAARPVRSRQWTMGTSILFRGENVVIETATDSGGSTIRFDSEILSVSDITADLRPAIEQHLWRLAALELPPRVQAFAAQHQVHINRITVRNQRSRWGSCSRRGTISLNWRLIQTPTPVQDYIILHELMHVREMNHSAKFWREVKSVCPNYEAAEIWLKQNVSLLR